MPFPIAVMAGLQAAQGVAGIAGSRSAANAQARGADNASRTQRRNVAAIRADTDGARMLGGQAMNALGSVYGYAPSAIPGLTPNSTYGGTPFDENDWRAINNSWGTIREAGKYSDISQQHLPQGLSAQGAQYLSDNWGNLRRAANFGDIDYTDPTLVGAPQYQTQAQPGNALAAPAAGPNYDAFYKSPEYDFTRREGMRGIENTFAAGGGAKSGNALRALGEFTSNLAAGNFQNWFNNQSTLAGMGQNAVNTNANVMTNAANVTSRADQNAGDARASGVAGTANAIMGGLDDAAGMIGYRNFLRRGPTRSNWSQSGPMAGW
jgi:hypothetical protein